MMQFESLFVDGLFAILGLLLWFLGFGFGFDAGKNFDIEKYEAFRSVMKERFRRGKKDQN